MNEKMTMKIRYQSVNGDDEVLVETQEDLDLALVLFTEALQNGKMAYAREEIGGESNQIFANELKAPDQYAEVVVIPAYAGG